MAVSAGASVPTASLPPAGAALADGDRDEIRLTVTPEQLRGLSDGSLVARDSLGRHLEIEIERKHGGVRVKGEVSDRDKRLKPGPVSAVTIVAAPQLR